MALKSHIAIWDFNQQIATNLNNEQIGVIQLGKTYTARFKWVDNTISFFLDGSEIFSYTLTLSGMSKKTDPYNMPGYYMENNGKADFELVVDNIYTDIDYSLSEQLGSLKVSISPEEAITAGCQWQIDGGAWNSSGATISNLTVGTHTVSFKDVTGWTKPANQTVTITSGQTATATGTYSKLNLPESVTSYKVLTAQSNQLTINYGDYVKVFGSAGANTMNVKSGGRVECVNFVGANVVNIEDSASGFTVRRSGAMLYLENATTGSRIKIPATKTSQTLTFAGGVSYTLIINNGKVMLGSNEVTLTESQL